MRSPRGQKESSLIPKIIHYVWLSGERKPREIRKCIASWKKVLPGYRIREWTRKDFPWDSLGDYANEALSVKKWAFATDYLRLWILYREGGIYLDSDVLLKRGIDGFLDNRFFSFIEYHENGFLPYRDRIDADGYALVPEHVPGFCIQAAFMGAEKGSEFAAACMDAYRGRHFLKEDGTLETEILAPDIYALCARSFGFRYKDCEQKLACGTTIYPSSYVAGARGEEKEGNYAVHCCAGSWRGITAKQRLKERLKPLHRRVRQVFRFL